MVSERFGSFSHIKNTLSVMWPGGWTSQAEDSMKNAISTGIFKVEDILLTQFGVQSFVESLQAWYSDGHFTFQRRSYSCPTGFNPSY